MQLTADQKLGLADVIAGNVFIVLLADIVRSQGVVTNFDDIRKAAPSDPQENVRAVALAVIEEYESRGYTLFLIEELYRRGWGNSGFTEAMSQFLPLNTGGEQQAAFALRAHFLQSTRLNEFLTECEPRLCVITTKAEVAGRILYSNGTGLLVAPDLVLTARHVLEHHILNGQQLRPSPGPLFAFFDHLGGDPIIQVDEATPQLRARTRPVLFHADWLVDTRDDIPGEAFDQPTPNQIADLKVKLDYALVRLAEPVGNYSRHAYGGARRGWFDLSQYAAPTMRQHDRIIIPQHPGGQPQRIDFGRFSKFDPSNTRLRYDAETAPGTSGAPCFNQEYQLVGMHNAAFAPNNIVIFNQAVHFDQIMNRLRPRYPPAAASGTSSSLWSVSPDLTSPRVIVGRGPLLEWIKNASVELPPSRKHRVYATAATQRGGKTFSLEILKAALPGTSDRIVEFGTDVEKIPTGVPDFVSALLTQLRITPDDIRGVRPMPPRPSREQTEGVSEDKLNVWLSRSLPVWFNEILLKARDEHQVDLRNEAQMRVQNPKPGLPPDPKDVEIANWPTAVYEKRSRWQRIWVVIDNASEDAIKPLQELITGLVGSRLDENAVPEELRRIRWLFLGQQKPDFIGEISWEGLDPKTVSADSEAVKECIRNLAASFDLRPHDQMLALAAIDVEEAVLNPPHQAAFAEPLKRLETLQAVIGSLHPKFARILKRLP